jgi:hypothetical protein
MRETIDLFKDQQAQQARENAMAEDSDAWSDEEEDFPEIAVDELQDLGDMMDTLAIEEEEEAERAEKEGGEQAMGEDEEL